MHPQAYLQFTGALLTFWLRLAVLCVLCACVGRLLRRPQHRFVLWTVFLLGSASYWAWILFKVMRSALKQPLTASPLVAHPPAAMERFLITAGPAALIERCVVAGAFAYVAVLVFFISRRLMKAYRLRALLRFAFSPSTALVQAVNSMGRELGVSRCELLVLPAMISPGTVYWRNPCILLPESCSETAAPELVDVLRHELVHIVRRDYLIAGWSDAVCSLLFFHPAVWLARKKMRLERELACDLAVVEAHPEHRADYADSLARFMRLRMFATSHASPGIDFADSASVLGTRIRSILAEPHKTPWWRNLYAASAGAFCLLLFVRCAPALSLEFDLNSQMKPKNAFAAPEKMIQAEFRHSGRRHEVAHHNKAVAVSANSSYAYPDNLTTLPVHPERSLDTSLPVSASPQASMFTNGDNSLPLWAEAQTNRTRSRVGTVREVVLATAGGIALGEHGERGEHGSHGHKLSH